MRELLMDMQLNEIPVAHQHNMEKLLVKINKIRTAYNKPMIVTSGYRTIQKQKDLYRTMGYPDYKIPMGSAHLKGAACDIRDRDGKLMEWCKANVPLLEEVGLWIEDDTVIPRVHFQIYAPRSGNRFFKP